MTHPVPTHIGLVRLGDSDFVPANPEDDLCGKGVLDPEGRRIGNVDDLYIDRHEREVRFLLVGAGGFLGVGEKHFLVPVEAVTEVAEGWVTIEPGRTERVAGPTPSTPESSPRPPATVLAGAGRTMVRMEAALEDARRPEAPDVGNSIAVWGITGIMAKEILPEEPAERRKRSRLRALRAMDRLGLLGEENLIPTLARRPALRWLADEEGARWTVLAELGRIGEPGAFEVAVEWALENRPRPEEVKAYIRILKSGIIRPAGASGAARSSAEKVAASGPPPRRATEKEERRRC